MRLVGMMPCRSEDWVLGLSARVALLWCDSLVILNHASDDRTGAILDELQREYRGRVIIMEISGPEWLEMVHRQALLNLARTSEATHLAIVDADEILTGNLLGTIRDVIQSMDAGSILQLPGYNLRGGITRYHANGIWGNRWFSVAFMDDPRLCWDGDRFHQREPMGKMLQPYRPMRQGQGGIMHLWGVSERRLRAKHCAYKMIETLRWPQKPRSDIDLLYDLAFTPSAAPQFDQHWSFAETPADWWQSYLPLMQYLDVDAEPWQESDCERLRQLHGDDRFAGLDLSCRAGSPEVQPL
jgi:hypothetical protein